MSIISLVNFQPHPPSPHPTPPRVETLEKYVLNLNEEYTCYGGDETYLYLNDDASDGGDDMDDPTDSQLVTNLMDWKLEARDLEKFLSNNRVPFKSPSVYPFKPFHNSRSPLNHDAL